MIPKEEIYIPPMSINILDHRHFGRKPIVGIHIIKSLFRFRVDRAKEEFVFSNTIQNTEHTSVNLNENSIEVAPQILYLMNNK